MIMIYLEMKKEMRECCERQVNKAIREKFRTVKGIQMEIKTAEDCQHPHEELGRKMEIINSY